MQFVNSGIHAVTMRTLG